MFRGNTVGIQSDSPVVSAVRTPMKTYASEISANMEIRTKRRALDALDRVADHGARFALLRVHGVAEDADKGDLPSVLMI